ncbi:MAG: TonB-dependent receptor [bacterium]|nr:TonB-dependent receptor [bacterium]
MRDFFGKVTGLMIGIILIMPQISWQEEVEEKERAIFQLEEIVVTATKMKRRISSLPVRVSVITGDQIKDSGAKNIPDLLKSIEGIYVYDSSGVGTAGRVNMRGFWGDMSTHNLVLIDGIPVNKTEDKLVDWNLIPLDNIERVEIVKGPVSALYGDNAFSGVINIITKEGSGHPGIEISSSFGSFYTGKFRLSLDGTKGNINYLLNISGKSTSGYRKHCNYIGIHLISKLGIPLGKSQDVKLSLGCHLSKRGAYPWALEESELKEDRTQARPGTENDEGEDTMIDLGITYHKDIGNVSRIDGTLYLRDEDTHSYFKSGKPDGKEYLKDERPLGLILRYETLFGKLNSFVIGADLEWDDFKCKEYKAFEKKRGELQEDYSVLRRRIGGYVQDEIRFNQALSSILALRYDVASFDFTNHKDDSRSKRDMSATSPSIGIVYNYLEHSSIYVNYSKAFRTPTLAQLFTYGSFANPELEPEKVDSYELGIRHRFGSILACNISFYKMNLENEIWYDKAEMKYKNYGETSHKGVEMGLEFNATKGLTGFTNYTYTISKNESGTNKGKFLAHVPKHKGSFGLRYQSDFGLGLHLTTTRVGRSFLDQENTGELPSYTVVDTKINWHFLSLIISNLFDEEYYGYGYIKGGKYYYNPSPGRTYELRIEIAF